MTTHPPRLPRTARAGAGPLSFALLLLLVLTGPHAPLGAQVPHGTPATGGIEFEEWTLENGLVVLFAPDPGATAVAVNLWYDVGSRHETRGRSGFAHLFEHLMFEGSEHVEQGDHSRLIDRAGGSSNASVTEDRTNYFQTVPPHRMNLALWLEADRMRALQVSEEALRREVEVVKEERRQRFDNAPYGTSQLATFYYQAYDPGRCFAYAHSPIGSMEDLDAARISEVREFYDRYYAPNNATLTLVGAFDPEEARGMIEAWFGPIPPGDATPDAPCDDPFRHFPHHVEVHDPNATLPAVWLSYGAVERSHPDAPALEMLARILGSGQSSRLHSLLVRREQAAVQASAFTNLRKGPGLLNFVAIANRGIEAERLLELLDAELSRIKDEGVRDDEFERVRNQVRSSTILGRQSVMGRAEALQSAHHFFGSAAAANESVGLIEAVTANDLRRVAATYLTPANRLVVFTRPGTAGDER
jgi:zinc protease